MRKKRKKILKPKNDTYLIIVDGETEIWYFQMLKRNEKSLRVDIVPEIPQKKKLIDQYERVIKLSKDYTKVFWIIDLDVVIAERKENELKDHINKLKKCNFDNVVTILNNPCLEFWFLLHFIQTTKYYPKCEDVEKLLKRKYLKDYKKTRKYFTKQDNDIYLKLKSRLPIALKNVKQINRNNLEKIKTGICEMNLFFEEFEIK